MSADFVKGTIEKYLEGHPTRNLSTLSRKCDIPYSTFRRIAQGECEPNFAQLFAILAVTMPTNELRDFLKSNYKKTYETFGALFKAESTLSNPKYTEHLRNPLKSEIFAIASVRIGTTKERIEKLFGERGMQALQELIESEILNCDTSGKITFKNTYYSMNVEQILLEFSHRTSQFQNDLLGTKAARISMLTESVSKAALEELHEWTNEYIKKVYALFEDPESEGPHPVYVGLLMNLLDATEFKSST